MRQHQLTGSQVLQLFLLAITKELVQCLLVAHAVI